MIEIVNCRKNKSKTVNYCNIVLSDDVKKILIIVEMTSIISSCSTEQKKIKRIEKYE